MSVKSRMKLVFLPVLPVAAVFLAAAALGTPNTGMQGTLRQYADKIGFSIGAPIPGRIFNEDPQYRDVLGEQFNSAVSFVFMKLTQPEPGRFNFRMMDNDMSFARAHHMKLFGAALVYRAQFCPRWLLQEVRGRWMHLDRARLDQILRNQIETVVRHGGDSYSVWEVVNEPLNRNQPWEQAMGREGYIAKAFQYAHEANPHAQLLLNQTFGHGGVNRDMANEFFDLVTRLKASGTPIDAVGIEMHLQAPDLRPTYLDEFRDFLDRARKIGVRVNVTEMDVYQGPPGMFQHPFERQKDIYQGVFSTCLQDSNCTGFYTWGISDAHTWLAQRPRNPLPDAEPLLFNRDYGKKAAYYSILEDLKQRASAKP